MLFKYHKLVKENDIDALHREAKESIIETIQHISKRPIASFIVYQVEGFANDLDTWAEDMAWVDKYNNWINSLSRSNFICRIFEFSVGFPCVIYFMILRFFICLFRWRGYYRDSSLILLKLA